MYQQVIVQDLIELLTKKGYEDFKDMSVKPANPINENDYFKFNIRKNTKLSFKPNLKISEGLYYEFN